jgi:hypothetical protein
MDGNGLSMQFGNTQFPSIDGFLDFSLSDDGQGIHF